MKHMKTLYLTAALVASSYALPVSAALTSDRQLMVFETTAVGVSTVEQTITIKHTEGDVLVLPTAPVKLTDGFDITTNTCSASGLAVGAECSITVDYTPVDDGKHSLLYEINASDLDSTPIFMSNYHDESAEDEARRRINPVIEKIVISSPTDLDFSSLEAGVEYTFDVYVAAYEESKANLVLFDCDADSSCGGGASANTNLFNVTKNATVLDDIEVAAAGLSDYHFSGFQAIHQKFSHTVPATGTGSIALGTFQIDGENPLVFRAYHRSQRDNDRRIGANVSIMLGGDLEIVSAGNATYYDSVARRLGLSGTYVAP